MQRLRFDLKSIFLAMSIGGVVAWGMAALAYREEMIALPIVAIFASLTCALYGLTRDQHPVILGAVGGFAGAAALAVCYCTLHGIGYLFYDGPLEYFEAGAIAELIIYPPIFVVTWGGIGIMFGLIGGAIVYGIQQLFLASWY